MLISAAERLALSVSQQQIDSGCLYPPLRDIREVSANIAEAVAESALRSGLIDGELREDFAEYVRAEQYDPNY